MNAKPEITKCLQPSNNEAEYLADSQFDFPGNGLGWRYYNLDSQNTLGTWRHCDASAQTATPRAFLVSDDPHCMLGRDFLHAGYRLRPVLQWHAPQGGTYLIEGEVSLVRSHAHGKAMVRLYVEDVCLVDALLDFPEILEFAVPVGIREGSVVRIVFGSAGHIDNNYCLYYARVRRASPVPAGEQVAPVIRKARSDAWPALETVVGNVLGPEADQPALTRLSQSLFGDLDLADAAAWPVAAALRQSLFGRHEANFRQPRMFSAFATHDENLLDAHDNGAQPGDSHE